MAGLSIDKHSSDILSDIIFYVLIIGQFICFISSNHLLFPILSFFKIYVKMNYFECQQIWTGEPTFSLLWGLPEDFSFESILMNVELDFYPIQQHTNSHGHLREKVILSILSNLSLKISLIVYSMLICFLSCFFVITISRFVSLMN